MKRLILKLIRWYQKKITVNTPAKCRYIPTCSQYAAEAVETRGVTVGLLLFIKRFLKCNPLFKGGYDPVPQKKTKK